MSVKVFSSLSMSSKTYYAEEKDHQVKIRLQLKATKLKEITKLMNKIVIKKGTVLYKDKSVEFNKINS